MNIYVGKLLYSIGEDGLKELFASFGTVEKASIITDKFSGCSKGFGFVEIADKVAAEEAIKALDGSGVQVRNLKANEARPFTERLPR